MRLLSPTGSQTGTPLLRRILDRKISYLPVVRSAHWLVPNTGVAASSSRVIGPSGITRAFDLPRQQRRTDALESEEAPGPSVLCPGRIGLSGLLNPIALILRCVWSTCPETVRCRPSSFTSPRAPFSAGSRHVRFFPPPPAARKPAGRVACRHFLVNSMSNSKSRS